MITIFELSGNDAIEFLNNQVVTELKNKQKDTHYTVICNLKGRIVFSLFFKITPSCIYVAVDSSLSDNFLQYVNMRRFRMNVDIKKSSYCLITPANREKHNVHLGTSDDGEKFHVGEDDFWLNMFEQGLPWITEVSSEQFIPQHLNLDHSEIIDFDKGCYPGQEVIARLHFLGKVKKRMQRISYQNETKSLVGKTIILGDNSTEAELCSNSIHHNGQWLAQGIIRN